MRSSDDLRRLHFINALFASVTGQDLYLAEQIKAAITTSLEEHLERHPDGAVADPAFTAAAVRLVEKLCHDRPSHGFFHWDAAESAESATPLFTRKNIMDGLKSLAIYQESTLLITNLRPAHCPPEKRWTARRETEYAETLALINDLAAARTRPSAVLHLLFL